MDWTVLVNVKEKIMIGDDSIGGHSALDLDVRLRNFGMKEEIPSLCFSI